MARIRSIKPDFFMSEQVCSVSFAARLLFAGLWTLADREGRLEWSGRKVKAQIFPYDEGLEIAPLAEALVEARLVRFYEDAAGVYLWLPTFTKHQRPHPKEAQSVIPPCPLDSDALWLPWKKTASREMPGTIPSAPGGREGKGREQEQVPAAVVRRGPRPFDRQHATHLHGFCDWVCLPDFLLAEFVNRGGKDEGAVATWAAGIRTTWQGQRIGDNLAFWRARWDEHAAPAKSDGNVEAQRLIAETEQRAADLRATPRIPGAFKAAVDAQRGSVA